MSDVPDEVREKMIGYLYAEAIPDWWHSSVPALDGRTPAQAWEINPDLVRQLIDAYGSGAFL